MTARLGVRWPITRLTGGHVSGDTPARRSYTAVARQVGRFWEVQIRELGRKTQASRFEDVERVARDLISDCEGLASRSFAVEVVVEG
jgi:hypothetical protein